MRSRFTRRRMANGPSDAVDAGIIRGEFKPGLENIGAGIVLGLLLSGGGCAAVYFPLSAVIESGGSLPFHVEKGWGWTSVILMWILGLGLVCGGVAMLMWMRALVNLRVTVRSNGFVVARKNSTQNIAWADITSVTETRLYERPPLLKGPARLLLPKIMSKSYIVKLKEGEGFGFDGTTIKRHVELADLIKEETDKRQIPWVIEETHG